MGVPVQTAFSRARLGAVEALYPKMEPGMHIKRGKATTYRYAEYVKKALMMRGDWLVNDPVHQEAVGRLERKLRRSDLTEEQRAKYERALEQLREEDFPTSRGNVARENNLVMPHRVNAFERRSSTEKMLLLTDIPVYTYQNHHNNRSS